MPAGDAVFLEHRAGLGVADAGLRVGLESTVVVGNHQGVGAEGARLARVALVKPRSRRRGRVSGMCVDLNHPKSDRIGFAGC